MNSVEGSGKDKIALFNSCSSGRFLRFKGFAQPKIILPFKASWNSVGFMGPLEGGNVRTSLEDKKTELRVLLVRQRKLILLSRKKLDHHANGPTALLEKLLFKHIALLREQNSLIEAGSKLVNAEINLVLGAQTKSGSRRRSRR